ncbi:MAG TPA: MFS transporter [Candidatus Saccharimonadales bacterium]|nr:MFS transporter [Candidatus Saccharimonadales bacterium]
MKKQQIRYTLKHYLLGAISARLGDEMTGQAILLLGISLGSAALGSTLLAGLTFSAAIGGPLLGAVLDRSERPGRTLALSLGLYAVGIGLIAWSIGHVPATISFALALLAGIFMPAISGGWSSRLKSFNPKEHMTRVSAIDAATFNIVGLAGPALAGIIAGWLGASWAVAVIIALLVAALPMAWILPKHKIEFEKRTSFLQDVLSGLKIIVTNRALFRVTLLSVISYMGIGMLWVICPLIGLTQTGSVGFGGIMMSVLSVGALIATSLYAKWPTKYSADSVALTTTIILATALLLLAFAGNVFVVLAAMFVAGLADGPQLAAVFSVRHREAPEQFRSQVFTTGASLKITAAAVGALVAGYLAEQSIVVSAVLAAGVQLLAALSYILVRKARH